MEIEKISDKRINKKATITHEGRISSSLGGNRYNVRLNSGDFLRNVFGSGGMAAGDSVIITKQGSVWNILQKTYDISGDVSEEKV